MRPPLPLLLPLLLLLSALGASALTSTDSDRLFAQLYDGYYSALMPPKVNGSFDVHFDLAITQLLDLDEKQQTVSIFTWKRLYWYDTRLAWRGRTFANGTTFDGISELKIPNKNVWVPDIVTYSDVRETTTDHSNFFCRVAPDGRVSLYLPEMMKLSCSINVAFFPYDQQSCPMKIGSWANNGNELNLLNVSDRADLSKLELNSEFCVISVPLKRNSVTYGCCGAPYIDITYTIVIQRKPLFYELNLVLPCVAILVVTLFGFRLPPESGERISLTVTILLALSVFLQLTGEHTPTQSDVVPLISQYFAATIALSSLCVLGSIGVLLLHFNGRRGKPMGRFAHFVFFGILGRLAFVRLASNCCPVIYDGKGGGGGGGEDEETREEAGHAGGDGRAQLKRVRRRCPSPPAVLTVVQSARGGRPPQSDLRRSDEPPLANELTNQLKRIHSQLDGIHQQLRALVGSVAAAGDEQISVRQWEMAALILDRLLFSVFCVCSLVITCLVFSIKPDNYQGPACPNHKA